MANSRSTVSRALRGDLLDLAAAAQRAFAADLTAVLLSEPGRTPVIAVAIGMGKGANGALRDTFAALLPVLAGRPLHEPHLADADLPGAAVLADRGYGALLGCEIEWEGCAYGALFVARQQPGQVVLAELMETFARQVAISVLQRKTRRRPASVADRLENLEALDQVALSTMGFDQLSGALDACIAPIVGADMTAVMVWDKQRDVLQMVPGSFGAADETVASYQISVFDRYSNAARVFSTGRPYVSNKAASDPGILQDYVHAFGIKQLLSLQLAMAGRPVGVLHLANKASGFTIYDIQRAEELGPRIATVIEFSRTMSELRRKQQLEKILSAVAVAIASGRGVQDFLVPALGELCAAMDAGMIALVPEGSDAIVARNASVADKLVAAVLEEAHAGPGVRAYVIDPAKARDPGRAVYHTPVNLGRERVGTIAALRARGEPFSQSERLALTRVANLSALAWASERYQQQRAELARLHERQRIADDLHDDVAQIIFAAQLHLDALVEHDGLDRAFVAELVRVRGLLVRGDAAIRTVIHQLSRPGPSDLAGHVASVVARIEEEFIMPVHLEISDGAAAAAKRISRPALEALLKVARESLVNAAKHAGPCSVAVHLDVGRGGNLRLRIVDDGVGISDERGRNRYGLSSLRRGIRVHGGGIRVTRKPAGGTTVTASLPV